MGLKHKKKRTKREKAALPALAVSPSCSTIVEESCVTVRKNCDSTIPDPHGNDGEESTLVSSSVCVVKGDVAGPANAPGEELPANVQAAEDDVKTLTSVTSSNLDERDANNESDGAVGSSVDSNPDPQWTAVRRSRDAKISKHRSRTSKGSSRTIERKSLKAQGPVKILPDKVAEVKEQRPLREVVTSFAAEGTTDDQRARDLELINLAIESNRNYLSRCSLRSDLLSLGVLKGLTSVANTAHPALSRELHRLVQGEARDLVIQAPPKGSNDQRCPVDLLFEWFDQSRDVEEHQQKHLLLRCLVQSRDQITEAKWARLAESVAKILEVDVNGGPGAKTCMEDDFMRQGPSIADVLRVRAGNLLLPGDNEDRPDSASTSPAPSDPDHDEKGAAVSSLNKPDPFDDDLTLITNAPMPAVKTRPRSVSRHRATRLALIPPNERLPPNAVPPAVSKPTVGNAAAAPEERFLSYESFCPVTPPQTRNRPSKCQSFSVSFVKAASPLKNQSAPAPSIPVLSSDSSLSLKGVAAPPDPPVPFVTASTSGVAVNTAVAASPEDPVKPLICTNAIDGEPKADSHPTSATAHSVESVCSVAPTACASDGTQCSVVSSRTSSSSGDHSPVRVRNDSSESAAPLPPHPPKVAIVSAAPPPAPPPPPPPPLGLLKIQTSSRGTPPPPPPPPPPPGMMGRPSTSPASPSCTARGDEIYPKKKKTYTLLWQAVSQHAITNVHTVWNEYSRPEFGVEERDHVQLVFERTEPIARSRFDFERRMREKPAEVSIFQLPQQKALNLEIILAKLRPITVADLVAKLESNDMAGISTDLLSSLLKYFPTDEEMLLFKKVSREEVKRNCDVLCWEAARRSTLKIRAELAIAREQILQDLARHSQSTQRLRAACGSLRSPVLIHLMHKCLQYGNYINQGTALSRAVGFSLSSLTSVLSAKGKQSNSLNVRLVDLLAQFVEFDTVALEDVITCLQSARMTHYVVSALRTRKSIVPFVSDCKCLDKSFRKSITLDDIETASKELTSSVKRLKCQLTSRAGEDASLLEAYQPFLEAAESGCASLVSELKEIRSAETSLQSFLCANSMKLEEITAVTSEALAMLSTSIKARTMVKLRSASISVSGRQLAGRDRLSLQRRSLQPSRPSVDAMRQMFLDAANQ